MREVERKNIDTREKERNRQNDNIKIDSEWNVNNSTGLLGVTKKALLQ